MGYPLFPQIARTIESNIPPAFLDNGPTPYILTLLWSLGVATS
jgi:hypothetical protein